jgi:tetratricopeptide (TPR) repeat protein
VFPFADLATLVFIPLIVITIRDLKRNWRTLWDDDVTREERALLLRAAFILSVTVMTLVHESGHVIATYHYGGRIVDFHYGVIHSWVTRVGVFTPEQDVWIAFAGNLIEIIVSLLLLVAACCLRSPAVVALTAYVGWISLANSILLYPLLSLAGVQGDWAHIYLIPAGKLNLQIGIFHALLLTAFLSMSFSNRAKLWFRRRTDPRWDMEYQRWLSQLSVAPSLDGWVNLGYTYGKAGLYALAKNAAQHAAQIDPESPEVARLQAAVAYSDHKYNDVIRFNREVTNDMNVSPRLRCMAWINTGHAYREMRHNEKSLVAYDRAITEDPFIGDARLFKTSLLLHVGNERDASMELKIMSELSLTWLDESNRMQYQSLLESAPREDSKDSQD